MVYTLKFINTFDKFNPRPFPKNRKHSRNDPVALMYQFICILQWFCCYFYSNVCIRQGFYSVEYFLFAFCLSSIFILLQHYTNNVTKIFFLVFRNIPKGFMSILDSESLCWADTFINILKSTCNYPHEITQYVMFLWAQHSILHPLTSDLINRKNWQNFQEHRRLPIIYLEPSTK